MTGNPSTQRSLGKPTVVFANNNENNFTFN